MARKILMNVAEGDECRIAVLENDQLFEYFVDRPSQLKHVGNIYKAVINNVEPGIQAAFVDIGLERNGFLHVSDVNYAYQNSPDLKSLFSKTLRIKEDVADDAIFETESEQDVEEVDEYVGDGSQTTAEAPNGAQDPEFLDRLEEEHAGHSVTESPLRVEIPEKEPPTPEEQDKAEAKSDSPGGEEKRRRPRRRRRKRRDDDTENRARDEKPEPAPKAAEKQEDKPEQKPEKKADEKSEPRPAPAPRPTPPAPPSQGVKLLPGQGPRRAETEAADRARQEAARAQQAAKEKAEAQARTDEPGTETEGADKPAEEKPKRKRRRTPKKRGGKLPKRVLEQEGDQKPTAGKAESNDATQNDGDNDAPGPQSPEGGSGPIPGPLSRFHRGPQPKLQSILKRGQEIVVQVSKASQGGKGPGLTTFVSLPGRYMVLTPNTSRGGVSRKIEDGKARNELRKMLDKLPVPEGMGVIIRTAAINRSFDDLLRDLNYLLRVWSVMVERIHEAKAPALLYSDSDPAIRTVRDYFTADTEEIIIDDREVYERVLAFFDQLMPSFKDRVKLYDKDIPLFFDAGLETEIDHIFDKRVPLKSGGYLFVEQTEALISIDVNSGKFTSAGDAEKTAYLTNKEAIPEICRQLRLRDLAGIVCCDLIDMGTAKHRTDIEQQLRRELRKDRARTKVARMSPFGVIEMTRQRIRPSIKNYNYVDCPTCAGFGMVRSAETLCLQLIRRLKLALVEDRVSELAVQVHPHVLSHLHSEFREDIDDLEEQFDKRIVFEYARDLVLGQTRVFYINDRGNRVLYDMDQRINTFVRRGPKSKSNVQLPASVSGAASPAVIAREKSEKQSKRRRRGGRRQREKEQERQKREERIQAESEKAVTFGDTLPAANVEVVAKEEKKKQRQEDTESKSGKKKSRRRGRRGGRKVRERETRKEGKEKSGKKKSEKKPASSSRKGSAKEPDKKSSSGPKKASEKKGTDKPARRSSKSEGGKSSSTKSAATKKSPAKKPTTTKKSAAKKTTAKKAPAKKTAAKKTTTRKATTKKAATTKKKPAAKKTAAKKAPAKKTAAKKAPAKKTTTRKATTKKAATTKKKPAAKKTAAKKAPAKKTAAKKAPAKKTTTRKTTTKKAATTKKKPAAKKTAGKKKTTKK